MSEKEYIGVFDSGVGGLTVLDSIRQLLPNENFVYFGDTKHLPYGEKTKEQIQSYVLDNVAFLNTFNLKALVIACGTADSNAREIVEERYHLPIYGVVSPASQLASQITKNNKIGVIATKATIESNAYEKAIHTFNRDAKVYQVACLKFVPIVEEERVNEPETEDVIKEYLQQLKDAQIDTLVLGCTHYPILQEKIQSFLPSVNIVSLSVACAQKLKEELKNKNQTKGIRKYFVSKDPEGFKRKMKTFRFEDSNVSIELIEK